jgi:uncharacterized membrane protein YfhO
MTDDEADRVTVHTSTASAGLLVLSDVYYPAWHAYVDGQPAHLYLADGALRAVAVPAGEHEVQLRYESEALDRGLLISCLASLLLAVLGLAAFAGGHARLSRGSGPEPRAEG